RSLQVLVSALPLGGCEFAQCLGGLAFVGAHLGPFAPFGPYPAPMTDEDHTPKEVALDHQGVEAGDVPFRLDPAQNQRVPDSGGVLIHAAATRGESKYRSR